MKRPLLVSGFLAALIGVVGCGSSKPEVPSWFKSGNGSAKDKATSKPNADASLTELSNKVKQLGAKIAALDKAIKEVRESMTATLKKLEQKGVRSSDDLKRESIKNDRTVKLMLESLERDHAEESRYRQLREEFELLKLEGENTEKRLRRQMELAKVDISDKVREESQIQVKKADAKLQDENPVNPISDLKAGDILDKEFKNK